MKPLHYYNDVLCAIRAANDWKGCLPPEEVKDYTDWLNNLRRETLKRRRRTKACQPRK